MPRSVKKGPFVDQKLLLKIDAMNESGKKKPIKTWSRRSLITPDFVGHTFMVHNGKDFVTVFVSENMVAREIRDERVVDFELVPKANISPGDVLIHADQLRGEVQPAAATMPFLGEAYAPEENLIPRMDRDIGEPAQSSL